MSLLVPIATFVLLAIASKEIGNFFRRAGLPLISGFLFVGILAGPYVLNIVPAKAAASLHFIDAIALAFIAFAAGSELHLEQLKGAWRSILFIIGGLVISVYIFSLFGYLFLAKTIPFMQGLTHFDVIAVALVGATIMVARSPASAYAIIRELRARGPFTKRVFGATVLMDSLVILLFAITVSIANVFIEGDVFNLAALFYIIAEIMLDIFFGIIVGLVLRGVFELKVGLRIKTLLMLVVGYGVFFLAEALRQPLGYDFPIEFFAEPLLVALVAGFYLANYTRHGSEFTEVVEEIAPTIFILFFLLVGLNINLSILSQGWLIILALFLIRLFGIMVGSFAGGLLAGDPLRHNTLLWLTFITQAGVSIGLAQEVAVEFPTWGNDFASLAIAVIVLNQIIGPPAFKWAIHHIGEAHPKAVVTQFDGTREVLIFGMGARALMLGKRLVKHGWSVKMICLNKTFFVKIQKETEIKARYVEKLETDILPDLGPEKVAAVVVMLPDDDQNYDVCEFAYEYIGTDKIVAFVRNPAHIGRFQALGVTIVEQTTAIISLLENFIRSPATTSLLLGETENQEIVELKVIDHALEGVAIRDLHLPGDVLILSIHRDGAILVTHGYTRLKVGDLVTVMGSPQSIQLVDLRLAGYQVSPTQTP